MKKAEQKPETRGHRKHSSAYPWDSIEVGSTFFATGHDESESQKVASLIQYYQDKLGKKFSMRTIDGKIKVWRDA